MSLGLTAKLILAFVTLILGAVLVGVVASNGLVVTDKTTVGNEANAFDVNLSQTGINTTNTYTVTNNPTGWKSTDCPLTSVSIKDAVDGTALVADTDYTLTASTGSWVYLDTDDTDALIGADNNTYVDYIYCGDDYLNSGWGRSVLNLVAGFFAVAILLTSVGLFFSIGKDAGII